MKKVFLIGCLGAFTAWSYAANEVPAFLKMGELEEVVVTGTRQKVDEESLPFSVTVVDRSNVEQSGETALFQVLSKAVPGLFVTERSVAGYGISTGASGGLSIRGLGASSSRVLMLIDGHPQFMGLFGHPVADAYMAQDLERVEVIRGPASVLYGSGAMGGAVNMITRRLTEDGMKTRFTGMAGSYDTQKLRAQNEYRKGKFSSFLSLNHDRTNGHRPNLDFRNTSGLLKLGYDVSKQWKLSTDVSVSKFKSEYPGPVTAPVEDSWGDILRVMSSVSLSNEYENTGGAATFFYSYGDHKVNDGHLSGADAQPLYYSNDNMYGLNIYQWYRVLPSTTATLGVDAKHYGGDARKGTMVFADNRHAEEYAVYGTVQQIILENLLLDGGARVEHSSVYGTEFIPQIGASYRLSANTSVKASVSKGFRSPNIRELYMFPPANDLLQPESMVNYETGVSQKWLDGRISTQLTVFYAKGKNLIQTVMTGSGPQNQNLGRFLNKGVEWSGSWQVSDAAGVSANYSYLWMEQPMAYTPGHKLLVAGNYTLGKFRLDADFQFIGNLNVEANPSAVPLRESYGVLDAQLTFTACPRMNIFLKGNNLTDRGYQIMDGFPMPGITGLFGITLNL